MSAAIHMICCVLFGIASWFDERERKIPRYISYMECLAAILCWGCYYFINKTFSLGNLVLSASFFAVIFLFYLKGQIGRADLYLVFSMLVLLSRGQTMPELLWEENLLFCIAFVSASVRLLMCRLVKKKTIQSGCPFAIHLFFGYLTVVFCRQ